MSGRSSAAHLTRAALGAALTAVSAQLAVPLPMTEVPFTLQVFAILVCGLILGPAGGALGQAVYVGLGAFGAPVFAGLSSGIGVLLGPTGGYLLAAPFAAAAAGWVASRRAQGRPTYRRLLLAAVVGVVLIYLGGVLGLQAYFGYGPGPAIMQGVVPFIAFDLIKAALAAAVAQRVLGARGRF
ncbi:MAG TPA: biotin transporter BioY [Bacillota bacterium]